MALFDATTGLVNNLSVACWSENATTVAGQANGTSGSGTNYLYWNRGISITSDDTLYIADRVNNRIIFVNLVGTATIHIFGGYGSSINQFNYPSDIAVTNTAIYVLDVNNARVQKWLRNGTNPTTMPGSGTFDTGFNLYVDSYNNLYVSMYYDHQVIRFAPNSSSFAVVAGNEVGGLSDNQLYFPNGIFVDDAKTMYIADTQNHRIQKWSYEASAGTTVAGSGGVPGSSLTQLSSPESLVVDTDGYMFIVDRGNNRIIRWSPDATVGVCVVACTGDTGAEANQLYYPIDVAFDTNGSLYVSDDGNSRVQKYQILDMISPSYTTSQTTSKPTTFESVSTTLHQPYKEVSPPTSPQLILVPSKSAGQSISVPSKSTGQSLMKCIISIFISFYILTM